jgi:2-polyprenyl-3-methyl-5-hydroxy-6-metoxy-1,4-benzoquinol methylase
MIDCVHNKDNIYNIWEAPKKTKLYKNEVLRYYQILSFIPNDVKSILDLGCGTGFMSCLMAKNNYNVTSIDKSPERLSYFANTAQKLKINVHNIDMFEFNNNGYDMIICQEVIEHIQDYKKVLEKIHSLLKENAFAIVTTPYRENLEAKTKKCEICGEYYHTNGHLHSFDEKKLQDACIEQTFEIIKTKLIVNNRAIKLFTYYNLPVNNLTIKIDKLINRLYPHKAAYLLVLIRKKSL